MNPYIENAITSIVTGVVAAGTFLLSVPPTDTIDALKIAATGIVAAGGAFLNGIRQLHLQPTDKA